MTLADVYIAGPMTGHPDFNYPAFDRARVRLEEAGWTVRSPAHAYLTGCGNLLRTPPDPEFERPWIDYMRDSIRLMLDCKAVYVLPGWEASRGATTEVDLARSLGLEVIEAGGIADQALTELADAA